MYHARDNRTGKIVEASKASRYGLFRCPHCKASVFLRAGGHRTAHFAHMPGQGKPECEEFHPSEDLRHLWTVNSFESRSPQIDPLELSIELESETEFRRGPRRWSLRLTVPKAYDDGGQLAIDLGGGDIRTISLSVLTRGAHTYTVNPDVTHIHTNWVSPEVTSQYRAAVEQGLPGLDYQLANVFSTSQSKLKPKCSLLRWGETYYLVWRSDRPITFPPEILDHSLSENREWSCSLITLPDNSDPATSKWIESATGLSIAHSKREWALLYPPPYAVNDEGNLLVPPFAQLLLAARAHDEDRQESALNCRSGHMSASVKLSGSASHLIEIKVSDQGPSQAVYLTWGNSPLASFVPWPSADEVAAPTVMVELTIDKVISTASLQSRAARGMLERVRTSGGLISAVQGHRALRGKFRWRACGELAWRELELRFTESQTRLSDDSAALGTESLMTINAHLHDRASDVEIDFGAFGQFVAFAVEEVTETPMLRPLRRELRDRIEWLCKISGNHVTTKRAPLGALDDKALVDHFSKLSVPGAVIAHWRTLMGQLRSANGKLKHE